MWNVKAAPGFCDGHIRWILISFWSSSGFLRFRSEFLLLSFSLPEISEKYLQPSGLTLSLFTFTHYVCTDASHFAALQLGFGLISEIWIDFDFPRSPVEVLKRRIVSLLTELHVSFGNFRKLLVPDVFTLLNWSVRAIRGILNTDRVRGFSHFFFLIFVFKVMAERGARLLLSLFCLTITVSHAEKGKTVIKEH